MSLDELDHDSGADFMLPFMLMSTASESQMEGALQAMRDMQTK